MSTTPRGIQIKADQATLLSSPAETTHDYVVIENTSTGLVLQSAIEMLDTVLFSVSSITDQLSSDVDRLQNGEFDCVILQNVRGVMNDPLSCVDYFNFALSGAIILPVSSTPVPSVDYEQTGALRYNTDHNSFEGYYDTYWAPPAGPVITDSGSNITGVSRTIVGPGSAVYTPRTHDLWVNTTANTINRYTGGAWVEVPTSVSDQVTVNDCNALGFEYYRNGFGASSIQEGIDHDDWDWVNISTILTKYTYLSRADVVSWSGVGKFANISQTMNGNNQFTLSGSGWSADEIAYEKANFNWVFTFELDLGLMGESYEGLEMGIGDMVSMGWHPSTMGTAVTGVSDTPGTYIGSFIPVYNYPQSMKFTWICTPVPNTTYQISFFGFGTIGGGTVEKYKAGSYALRVKMNRVPRTFLTL